MSKVLSACSATFLFLVSCGAPVESDSTGDGDGESSGGALLGDGDFATGGLNAGTGAEGGDGGSDVASGGSGTGGAEPNGPVAELFQHCDYGGWTVSLEIGDYTTADLIFLGALDNDASSLHVAPGFEVVLFEGDDFTGSSVTITADTPCVVAHSFN